MVVIPFFIQVIIDDILRQLKMDLGSIPGKWLDGPGNSIYMLLTTKLQQYLSERKLKIVSVSSYTNYLNDLRFQSGANPIKYNFAQNIKF